jgi:hypothetical protein
MQALSLPACKCAGRQKEKQVMEEELNPLAKEVILLLVFEEPYGNIISELKSASEYAVTDELKHLIAKDFVKPCKDIVTGKSSGFIYDSDRMQDYSFMLTAKGISYLETFLKE